MYATFLERPEESSIYNRYDGYNSPVVLHKDWNFHLGRFPSMEKLKVFMDFAGLELGELVDERDNVDQGGIYRRWNIEGEFCDEHFSDPSQLPEDAKPFTGLSNGSLVTCYLVNKDGTLHIYRPNPNYPDIYKPLSVEDHIAYCRTNGYV